MSVLRLIAPYILLNVTNIDFLSESSNTQSLSVDEKQAALQRLSSTISELSNAVRDAASFLPSRDQQNYTNVFSLSILHKFLLQFLISLL